MAGIKVEEGMTKKTERVEVAVDEDADAVGEDDWET